MLENLNRMNRNVILYYFVCTLLYTYRNYDCFMKDNVIRCILNNSTIIQ